MVQKIPDKFSFQLLIGLEKFAEPLKNGKHRIPALETPALRNLSTPGKFHADIISSWAKRLDFETCSCGGFNSVGIAAPVAREIPREWMLEGQPPSTCGRSISAGSRVGQQPCLFARARD